MLGTSILKQGCLSVSVHNALHIQCEILRCVLQQSVALCSTAEALCSHHACGVADSQPWWMSASHCMNSGVTDGRGAPPLLLPALAAQSTGLAFSPSAAQLQQHGSAGGGVQGTDGPAGC